MGIILRKKVCVTKIFILNISKTHPIFTVENYLASVLPDLCYEHQPRSPCSVNTARFLKYVWPIFKIMHEKVKNLTLPEASFAYFKLKFDQSLKEEECHEKL